MIEEEIQQFQHLYDYMVEFLVTYSFQLLGAVFVALVGIFVARKVATFVLKLCMKHQVDITLATFLSNVFKIVIIVLVGMIALGKVGISLTPFIAAVGALSLGAGLALQGVLSNYGAGLTIILARHFKVGDTISVQQVTGVVQEVRLSHTILINEDDAEIIIPNRHVVGEVLHNSFQYTLVEGSVGVAYGSDMDTVIDLIRTTLQKVPQLEANAKQQVGISHFGESSIVIDYRYQAPTQQLFETKYRANLEVFKILKEHHIHIPFPQRDVHITSKQT
ncbi:MAG: mechanosensitive ion channel [Mariprofundaceae bacterium]|nr:mechanosensitive ion channel [Mariprofundaceae bacterium]